MGLWRINEEGVRSKAWVSLSGRPMGGRPFHRGALFGLLKNRTYLGEIRHGEMTHPGAHPGIVDLSVFEAVEAHLASQMRRHRDRPMRGASAMLKGIIFDAEGMRMTPSFTSKKNGRIYRYYVSGVDLDGLQGTNSKEAIRRAPGPLIDRQVKGVLDLLNADDLGALVRVEVHPTTLQILLRRAAFFRRAGDSDAQLATLQARVGDAGHLTPEPSDPELVRVTLPGRITGPGARVEFKGPWDGRARRLEPDLILIKSLRRGHRVLAEQGGAFGRPEGPPPDRNPSSPHDRSLVCLAYLAPDIQARILAGKHPPGVNLAALLKRGVTPSWVDQRRVFGIPADSASAR